MQVEILGTLDASMIDTRLGVIGAKLREVRSLVRQYEGVVGLLAAQRLDERGMRRAELLDELYYEEAQLVCRADELLDELLRRSSAS